MIDLIVEPRQFALAILFALMTTATAFGNDLAVLSDEFEDAATMPDWQRIHLVEQWNADQLETYDINATQPGRMVMMPYTAAWFQNWRGPLAFKEITGNFALTAEIHVLARDGVSIPGANSQFSLCGLMVRAPRNITPATWTPGGENYVFLSLGHGDNNPATYQYEVKTTEDSDSTLFLTQASGPTALIQLVRIDDAIITLRQEPGQNWVVHRRFPRGDLPSSVQVGLVTYTDWVKLSVFDPFVHNSNVLALPLPPGVVDPAPAIPFDPDIIGSYEYARYYRPTLPAHLAGLDLTDDNAVPDAELLAFLGENVNLPASAFLADMNCDSQVDLNDIGLFTEALVDGPAFTGCDIMRADTNNDDTIDALDIESFVSCILNEGCS